MGPLLLAEQVPVHGLVHGTNGQQWGCHHLLQVKILVYFDWNLIMSFRVILPLFNKHSPTIDRAIEKAGSKAGDIFDKALDKAKDIAAEAQLNKNKDE